MVPQRCINCGKNIEWTVLSINLSMFFLKAWFAAISQSRSLLTDAFQSLANFIITIVILISLRMASRGADKKFPYGYGKVELLASGIVNTVLMIGALIIVIVSLGEMAAAGPEIRPKLIAIVAAVISIIANQIAYTYGRCAGERLGSTAILANAMVNRADVATSVAVIVAVVGSNLGISRLDHIVAIVIGGLIVKVTFDGARKAIRGLMDASEHREELHIRNLTEDIEGVQGVGDVKARLAGRTLWVDLNVFVPADWALSRGLETVRKIKNVLHRNIENISQVSVQLLPVTGTDDHSDRTNYRSERIVRRGSTYVPYT